MDEEFQRVVRTVVISRFEVLLLLFCQLAILGKRLLIAHSNCLTHETFIVLLAELAGGKVFAVLVRKELGPFFGRECLDSALR